MRRHVLAMLAVSAMVIYSCKNHPQGDCCAQEDTLEYIKAHGGGNAVHLELVKGTWQETTDSATVITIADSVRYSQSPGVAYPYVLKNDSLFISIENIPFSGKIIMATADSLVIENKGAVTRYSKKSR